MPDEKKPKPKKKPRDKGSGGAQIDIPWLEVIYGTVFGNNTSRADHKRFAGQIGGALRDRLGAAQQQQVDPYEDIVFQESRPPPAGEPRRGRYRGRRGDAGVLVRGPFGGIPKAEEAWKKAARRRWWTGRTRDTGVYRGIGPIGGAIPGFGQLTFPGGNPFWASEYLFRKFPVRQRPAGVGRRGSAATRPLQPSAAGSTNRTGAAATRAASPANDAARDAGTVVRRTHAPSPLPRPVMQPLPAPSGRQVAGRVPSIGTSPLEQLAQGAARALGQAARSATRAIASRLGGARVVNPLPTTLARLGTPPRLTASNSPLIESMGQAQPQPLPQTDPCKRTARKQGKKRCKNPVISRTTRDGIRTTKVRLTCRQSKLK